MLYSLAFDIKVVHDLELSGFVNEKHLFSNHQLECMINVNSHELAITCVKMFNILNSILVLRFKILCS